MSLSIDSLSRQRMMELQKARVNGIEGAGLRVLVLILDFQGYAPSEVTYLRSPTIRLELGGSGQTYIGVAAEDHKSVIEMNNCTYSVQMQFRLALTDRQIEFLERYRNGGDINFTLWFFAEAASGREVRSVVDKDEVKIAQSEWVGFLSACGHKQVFLYEIEAPATQSETVPGLADLISEATADLHMGRYDECVGRCRRVVEVLDEANADGESITDQIGRFVDKNQRERMQEEDRIKFVLAALRHAAHTAHHGRAPGFSREQAKGILGALTAIVSSVAGPKDGGHACLE